MDTLQKSRFFDIFNKLYFYRYLILLLSFHFVNKKIIVFVRLKKYENSKRLCFYKKNPKLFVKENKIIKIKLVFMYKFIYLIHYFIPIIINFIIYDKNWC
jgi:hypothetical protein